MTFTISHLVIIFLSRFHPDSHNLSQCIFLIAVTSLHVARHTHCSQTVIRMPNDIFTAKYEICHPHSYAYLMAFPSCLLWRGDIQYNTPLCFGTIHYSLSCQSHTHPFVFCMSSRNNQVEDKENRVERVWHGTNIFRECSCPCVFHNWRWRKRISIPNASGTRNLYLCVI